MAKRAPTDSEIAFDALLTPQELADASLTLLAMESPSCILDPGCGDGAWGIAARKRWPRATIVGIDIRPEAVERSKGAGVYDTVISGDFLASAPQDPGIYAPFDLVLGNPPYTAAEQFVRHAHGFVRHGGYVVQLLRMAFYSGVERAIMLYPHYPLAHVASLFPRPSFTGDGNSDPKTEYGVFLWRKGQAGATTTSLLEWRDTPTARRLRALIASGQPYQPRARSRSPLSQAAAV